MTNEDQKPDGYVAWKENHLIAGYVNLPKTPQQAEERACLELGHFVDADFGEVEVLPEDLCKDGWRIRPVKLVYLDEEKEWGR